MREGEHTEGRKCEAESRVRSMRVHWEAVGGDFPVAGVRRGEGWEDEEEVGKRMGRRGRERAASQVRGSHGGREVDAGGRKGFTERGDCGMHVLPVEYREWIKTAERVGGREQRWHRRHGLPMQTCCTRREEGRQGGCCVAGGHGSGGKERGNTVCAREMRGSQGHSSCEGRRRGEESSRGLP